MKECKGCVHLVKDMCHYGIITTSIRNAQGTTYTSTLPVPIEIARSETGKCGPDRIYWRTSYFRRLRDGLFKL